MAFETTNCQAPFAVPLSNRHGMINYSSTDNVIIMDVKDPTTLMRILYMQVFAHIYGFRASEKGQVGSV